MAGTYNRGKFLLAGGSAAPVDWDTSDIRALLVTSAYVFDNAHNFVSDVTANELTGGTYVRKATTRTVAENDTNDRAELTCANIVWTALTATGDPAGVIFFRETATSPADSNRELLSFHEFTSTTTNGGDFTVSFTGTNATFVT